PRKKLWRTVGCGLPIIIRNRAQRRRGTIGLCGNTAATESAVFHALLIRRGSRILRRQNLTFFAATEVLCKTSGSDADGTPLGAGLAANQRWLSRPSRKRR